MNNEYKYIIRYRFLHKGERVTAYFVKQNPSVKRSAKIGEAYLFDTENEAALLLKQEAVRAGLGKIMRVTKKEIFKLKLNGG